MVEYCVTIQWHYVVRRDDTEAFLTFGISLKYPERG